MGVYIPNMEKPKKCDECWALDDKYDYPMCLITQEQRGYDFNTTTRVMDFCPLIEIVRCGECKHRPIKDDPDGEDYGFNIVEPTDGDDICPCLVEDGWYSWMPKDNFYCGRGERNEDFDPYQGERDRDENGEIY